MNETSTLINKGRFSFAGKSILLQALLFFICFPVFGQVTLSTTSSFPNTEAAGIITLNFQNTNAYPVTITDIESIAALYGSHDVQIWYKPSAVNGAPGEVSATNGWTMAIATTFWGVQNFTSTITQPLVSNMSLSIPANSTYGLAVVAYGATGGALRVGAATSTVTQSGGGCNMITGTNVGYSGPGIPPTTPATTPRGFIGKIKFFNASNCTGTPNTPVISGPSSVCPNSLFNLTATGFSIGTGLGYQWQFFNTASGLWVDIVAATTPSGYVHSIGITGPTQFRLKTTCALTATQSFSNTITVGIGGAVSGTFTINNNLPSTSSNFTSFTAAAASLSCGINGPVTINVAPGSGPYTETVVFGDIAGTSSVNTIRLNGNGAIIQYANTANYAAILRLKGTDYMTVDSLHVRSLNQNNSYGISLSDSASHDSVTHCFVDMSSVMGIASNTNSAGISLSNDYFATNTTANATSCFVGYNHVLCTKEAGGAYFGIVDGWNNVNNYNTNDTGNIIAYNEVENFSYYGITIGGSRGGKVLYNNIHRTNKASGTYFVGVANWDNYNNVNSPVYATDVQIIGNRIHNPSMSAAAGSTIFYGIYTFNNNYANNANSQHVLIANNAIYNIDVNSSSTNVCGIIFWSGNNINSVNNSSITKIYHNTIDFSQVLNGSNNIYGIYGTDYWNTTTVNNDELYIKNNLVTITAGSSGAKYGFYHNDYNNTVANNWDLDAQRNVYYVNSSQPGAQYYAHYDNVNYPTLASFQAAYPAWEIGSITANPQYTNPAIGDFTPLNYTLYGNGVNLVADVPRDILGRYRSATPTPGAFEIATDAGVSALVAPTGTYCSSIKQVKVSIVNSGITNINTVQVHWKLNGVPQPMVTYTGLIVPGASAVVTLGNGTFMPNSPVTIKAWTALPNGQTDGMPYNDTLVVTTQSTTSVPVNLGADELICTGSTRTLDAGYPGSVYLWDNNATTQTRVVSTAGTYYVKLTALDGCIGVDTFVLGLRPLPVVDLGPDREICLGQTTTFDAGHPGASYLWDDGSTLQTRTVDTAGNYEVQVTDQFNCTGVDEVNVGMKDIPMCDGINATHADSGTYTFYPLNPLYTTSYRWNFGDGSPEAMGYMVQHTYATVGIYTVTLYLEGECTGLIVDQSRTVDVFSVHGGSTGINEHNKDGNYALYPNPARDVITIQNSSQDKMLRLMVYNALGQVIINQPADNARTHQLHLDGIANGIYTLRLETDKGYVIRKFEVLK